jgi:YVTN family beta-propeller protein
MNQKKLFFYLSLFAALFITACSDTEEPTEIDLPREAKILLILNEGSWGQNNSTLARYDLETGDLDPDYFRSVNQRGLGDVGNDMILYGTKIYIAVNGSSTLEVVEAVTGKSIRQIPMETESGQAKQPRRVAAYDGKIYVTSFDDTVTRIDTASLMIDGSVTVGQDPEGIAIKGGKIYVANSGGLNWANGYDNTVSVIDAITFTEEKKIEVGVNPFNLQADSQGDIYVFVMGNYGDISPALKRVNPATGAVEPILEVESPVRFVISDNKAYIISRSYGNSYKVVVYDCLEEKLVSDIFVTDGTETDIIYNIAVDEYSGDLYLMETDYTIPGTVYCFDKEGKLKYSIPHIGLNPNTLVILR